MRLKWRRTHLHDEYRVAREVYEGGVRFTITPMHRRPVTFWCGGKSHVVQNGPFEVLQPVELVFPLEES